MSRHGDTETRRTTEKAGGRRIARDSDGLTGAIIGAAIEVHRCLGPGLLESAYEECLAFELQALGLRFQRQVELPVTYKGKRLSAGFRIDLVVEDRVIVENKSVEQVLPVHLAQLLTYLRLARLGVGLLINFNVPVLADGINRVLNDSRH